MQGLPLGACFQPTDQQILHYLDYYAAVGQPLDGGFIMQGDLRHFQVEQPPDVRSLERRYYYTRCFYRPVRGPPTRDRRTVDGRGRWKSIDGQKTIYGGFKQDFRFFFRPEPSGEEVSTSWVMTEYTLNSNRSNNKFAVCVLRKTRAG